MNTDTIALLIAGCFGFIAGGTITFIAAGVFAERLRRKAERTAWREARRFYSVNEVNQLEGLQ